MRPKKTVQQERKIGSIIVPTTVRHKKVLTEGEVVQTGRGTPDIPMEVKPGDKILFHNMDNRLRIGEDILMDMEDVLLIINE